MQLPVFRARMRAPYEQVDEWTKPEYDDGDWKQVHALRGNALFADDASVLLRAELPPGVRAIETPLPVTGEYALWLNGQLLAERLGPTPSKNGQIELGDASTCGQILAIETYAHHAEAGLMGPIEILCGPAKIDRLDSWMNLGFGYYSGRVLYRKKVQIEDATRRVWLDLGQVQHYVEVYINGRLVDTLLWPPYEMEVTDSIRQGENEIALVVSNSIANRFAWDVWGTRGSATGEPSGILGPACLWVQP